MSTRPSSRPGITEQWPKHRGNIVMSLNPPDKVYFRMVNERCNPEIVGSGVPLQKIRAFYKIVENLHNKVI